MRDLRVMISRLEEAFRRVSALAARMLPPDAPRRGRVSGRLARIEAAARASGPVPPVAVPLAPPPAADPLAPPPGPARDPLA